MPLTLEPFSEEHRSPLFAFWRTVGIEIPYFFPVSPERWQACLLADALDGERKFRHLETFLAFDAGRLVGFVQFGQPGFAWNERGERIMDPAIGVIRHLYFEREAPQAGRALLAQAERFLASFRRNHAFYHILGMSCNAHHGKLHESQAHVEALLLDNGFQVEQENVYYVLDIVDARLPAQRSSWVSSPPVDIALEVKRTSDRTGVNRYEARLAGSPVGSAEVRFLDLGTSDLPSFAYLSWIGLVEGQRGRGLGALILRTIVETLKGDGYRYLHTDTSSTNTTAQQFYEKFGFCHKGKTRGYVRGE